MAARPATQPAAEVPAQPQQGSTLRLVFPRPHAAQQKIISEAKRFNVLDCGARFGKTTLGIDRIAPDALKGRPTAWFAPTYKLLAEPWREIQSSNWLGPVIRKKDENEHRIELVTGGSIDFWTLEDASENTARGRRYAQAVVDEAAGVKNLVSIWQRLIRTRLSDYRGGAWFLSTPRGMNDFKVLYDYGQDPNRPEWMSWKMPTSANPFIHADEIESARQELTEARFSQEYLGEFINWEGTVFRKIREAVKSDCLRNNPESGHQYVIGVDWGRSIDFTVFVVLDITIASVVAIDRSNQVNYSLQRGRLEVLRDKWHPIQIIAEINSIGQPIIEQLEKDGVRVNPFLTSNASKAEAVESLALAFERSQISIPDDPTLISELESFTGTVLPSGMIRYAAPEGQHDDIAMGLVVAWHGGFAGNKVLGLVELVKQQGGGNDESAKLAELKKKIDEMNKLQTSSLIKPAIADNTTRCEFCGSPAIARIGSIIRCNSCGRQKDNSEPVELPSRKEWLLKAS
jgi:hypothetical protein